jgi:hypothetical protein
VRTRIEAVFGWIEGSAGQRKTNVRGLEKVRFAFTLAAAAYNLVGLPRLLAARTRERGGRPLRSGNRGGIEDGR